MSLTKNYTFTNLFKLIYIFKHIYTFKIKLTYIYLKMNNFLIEKIQMKSFNFINLTTSQIYLKYCKKSFNQIK